MIKLQFAFEKDTKNARKFTEITERERGIVGGIYILRKDLQELGPDVRKIEVTIKESK